MFKETSWDLFLKTMSENKNILKPKYFLPHMHSSSISYLLLGINGLWAVSPRDVKYHLLCGWFLKLICKFNFDLTLKQQKTVLKVQYLNYHCHILLNFLISIWNCSDTDCHCSCMIGNFPPSYSIIHILMWLKHRYYNRIFKHIHYFVLWITKSKTF